MSIELRFEPPPLRGASARVATDGDATGGADDPGAAAAEAPAAVEDVP